ncbi:TerC family protein [Flavicella sediminum]|uniref:TerC family protein n=1 Tax=Flavicella sediminum TaxID=2585141 RepID=UPI00111F06D1|nr:TerC family protein [Flavicella sediminum]
MEIFTQVDTWIALLTLTFLEIVLGIDNIIFISITTGKLPKEQQKKATNIGLLLAMVFRVILLLGVSYLIAMKDSIIDIETSWLTTHISGQSIILIIGGLFLLYKSTSEIHHKVEGITEEESTAKKVTTTLSKAIVQIVLIDIVFSFDSVLTAVGMTNGTEGALVIMITAVVVSMLIMMLFANPVGKFVNAHPTIQMLALSFLILIGFMLITEGAHLAQTEFFHQHIGAIPKGYLYFAITFSLGVEALNMKIRKKKS